jgi:hypothetical protein
MYFDINLDQENYKGQLNLKGTYRTWGQVKFKNWRSYWISQKSIRWKVQRYFSDQTGKRIKIRSLSWWDDGVVYGTQSNIARFRLVLNHLSLKERKRCLW